MALLALKTGAPVIPVLIEGTRYREGAVRSVFTRHRARVRYGPPVDLSEFRGWEDRRGAVRAATAKIYGAIWALGDGLTGARGTQ